MANPLKVLTQLSASKEAQFAEVVEMQKTVTVSGGDLKVQAGEISGSQQLKIGGAAELASTLAVAGNANLASALDVKGAAALSGSLGVVGAADMQSSLTLAGAADFNDALDVAGDVNFQSDLDVAGYAKVQGEISGSAALNIGGAAHVAGNAQFDAQLNVDGAADFDSTLDVAGNVTMQASASLAGDLDMEGNADIAGNLDVHGNATIYGNLDVKGTMTTIESTTVTVADANIQLATVASPTDSTADGAGITILGATNKTFQWNNDGHGFTSSEDMNLAAGHVYKIDGSEVLAKDGSAAKMSFEAGAASISVSSAAVAIAGDLDLADDLHVSGTLGVDGVATFGADITASANVDVAGNVNLAAASAYKINDIRAVELLDAGDGEYWTMLKGQGAAKVGIKPNLAFMYGPSGVILDGGAGQVNLGASGLTVAPLATFNSDISASAGLDVAGAAHVAGAADFDAAVNMDDTLAVAGVASFASDVSASAGLDVVGNVHFANSLHVDLDGNFGSLQVNNATTLQSTLSVADQADFNGALNANAGAAVTGELSVSDVFNANGAWNYFAGDVLADAELKISGSAFTNITTPIDGNNRYSVNDAIRALDAKAGTMSSNINNNYNALRYLAAANFDANGMAAFTSSFAAAAIEQVSVDVLVQAGGSGPWTNDLVSVQVKAAGSYVGFEISAPAMGASDKVRIIAVKESGSLA